ncbi:Uncharacterised protein [Mycobacterium tuberculosis]|nr:Uncharacterised protein [Mycobacterium tuberculosis]
MDIYIGVVPVIRNEKAKPFGMRLQPSPQQVHPLRHTIAIVAGTQNQTLILKLVEQFQKFPEILCALQFKMQLELVIRHRFICRFLHKIK